MDTSAAQIVEGRSCADCTLCCKLLGVDAIAKPRHVLCEHCDAGKGCRIYAARPDECAVFNCSYLLNEKLGAHWKPVASGIVVTFEPASNRTMIYVDEAHTHAWRREPYFSEIKQWAVEAIRIGGQVVVWEGLNAVVVFPNREQNMGPVPDGHILVTAKGIGPAGAEPVFQAFIMDKDDSRLSSGARFTVDKAGF